MSNLKMLYVELGFYALNLLLFQLIRLNFFDYGAERLLFSFKVMLQITKKKFRARYMENSSNLWI